MANEIKNEEIILDSNIFSLDSVLKSSYKLSAVLNFSSIEKRDNNIYILVSSKNDNLGMKDLIEEFKREVIDQEVRQKINKETKELKEQIVKRAFSSIN